MFSKFDKVTKLDALLHDSKFGIAIANLKGIFDLFLPDLYLLLHH